MMLELCPKCPHYERCKRPCPPVEEFLRLENLSVFEKSYRDSDGKLVSVIFSRSRETPESDLPEFDSRDKPGETFGDKREQAFSTENESPFSEFDSKLKRTGIFIDRFFHKWSFTDLAVKYDVTPRAAIGIYAQAIKRIKETLQLVDNFRTVKQLVLIQNRNTITLTELRKLDPDERKRKLAVEKSKRYLERHRDKVNASRREHYQANKDEINKKRREAYVEKTKPA